MVHKTKNNKTKHTTQYALDIRIIQMRFQLLLYIYISTTIHSFIQNRGHPNIIDCACFDPYHVKLISIGIVIIFVKTCSLIAILIKIQYIISGGDETVRQHQYANSLYFSESTFMQNDYSDNCNTNGNCWSYLFYPVLYTS